MSDFAVFGRTVSMRARVGATVVSAVCAAVLAGCGSSDGSGSTGESGGAKVDEAKSLVAEYQAPPTTFNLPPLKSAPPRGKKIALVFNNIPGSIAAQEGAQEAAAALGWSTVPIVYDPSTPTGLQDAFAQAVAENADGVVTSSADLNAWDQAAQRFTEADIPVVTSNSADEVTSPLIANVLDAEQVALSGRITANYVVAEEGADANVAMINIPSFSILQAFETGFKEEYHRLCPDCGYKSVAVQASDIGTKIPSQVVSAVQTDPSINFAVMGAGDFTVGVSGALRTAGISGVKIVGEVPNLANIRNLIDGSEDMWVGFPIRGSGWKSIDALARFFSNEPVQIATTAATPFQILTKSNVAKPAEMTEVERYQDYFKELWQVD